MNTFPSLGNSLITAMPLPDTHARSMRAIGNEIWFNRKMATADVVQERDFRFNVSLMMCGVFLLTLLIFLKAKTVTTAYVDPVLIAYTSFVTLFQLSRLITSLMYHRSYTAALEEESSIRYRVPPKISFVIPCMNEENEIQNTIRSCFASAYPSHLLEIIVINDASTDNSRERILEMQRIHPQLVFVDWTENKGKRHGMAEGFRRATGEIVLQLDSDSRVNPEDVPRIVELFVNPRIGAVSFHTDPANADQNLLTKLQAAYYFFSFRILKAAESTFRIVFCCSGCASAYRRTAVLPFLDEWLEERFLGKPVTWGDDRSITNRVIKAGYETLYSDRVRAYTIVPSTVRQFLKQQIRWKKGWFVNSLFAARFIIQRDPFVALTYFFPLMMVTVLAPFMAARSIFYTPFVHGFSSTGYYVLGVLAIAGLIAVTYRYYSRANTYWPYVFAWAIFNMFILSFLLVVALATIQNRSWGTRALKPQPA